METRANSSELHLKKELSALRKAQFLRDPETCSSWKSPLSSRSVASLSRSNYGNGNRGYSKGANNSAGSFEVESNCNVPLRNETGQNKVYLYNWGRQSSKVSDSSIKLDCGTKNDQVSVEGSLEGSPDNHENVDSMSDYVEGPAPVSSVRGINLETTVRKTVRKLRRNALSKECIVRNSALPKLLDLPSSSLGVLDSIEPSDDTEYCISEDLRHSTQELIQKTGYASSSVSPLFSRSGCGKLSHSSKIWKYNRRDESSYSCTPASTRSYSRHGHQDDSTMNSWDGTTTSFDRDEIDQMETARSQGCGIPHYSSKRMKDRSCGGWCSPSLSDTLRKGSSILCGSQSLYNKRRSFAKHRSSGSHKQKLLSEASQGLPLLTNGCDGGRSLVDTSSDGLSTNFGELDLEALSRLDGRRWSNCRSQESLELTLPTDAGGELPEHRSLSQKYRPRSFEEIFGQKIVVQSLQSAILRGRIAPAYLFHGPRGTGKTSTARVFAAALNCLSTEESKPCGFCKECMNFVPGNGPNVRETVAADKKGVDRIRYVLKNMSTATSFSQYMVFVIDECHMLSSKVWSAFLKFLEEPPPHVVFVFITIDSHNLPTAILSRCQRYLFPKIKDSDIVSCLGKLSASESLVADLDALELIALNSEGSLRDAETMLDQLSLLGKRITTSMVNDLVGVVSDEKLLDLLEMAMSSDTAETVRRSRDIMDSGVDPMALMSQLAGLIMNIIAGTYQLAISKSNEQVGGQSLTDAELDRLHQALKFLSDAEKQLRLSSERATWFTAALLQLGSDQSSELTRSTGSSGNKQSCGKIKAATVDRMRDALVHDKSDILLKTAKSSSVSSRVINGHSSPHANLSSNTLMRDIISNILPAGSPSANKNPLAATNEGKAIGKGHLMEISLDKLGEIWQRCIDRCHSRTLRQLLSDGGKLVSISENEGVLIAVIAFGDENIKFRAGRFLSSITDAMEIVVGCNVEVRIGSLPDTHINATENLPNSLDMRQIDKIGLQDIERKINHNSFSSSGKDTYKESLGLPGKSVDSSDAMLPRTSNTGEIGVPYESVQLTSLSSEGNGVCIFKEKAEEVLMQKKQRATIDEQRLESAWLQAVEKGAPGMTTSSRAERNQSQNQSMMGMAVSPKNWEGELNHEIKALKINYSQDHQKEQIGMCTKHCAVSPSLLHSNNFGPNFDKVNLGYESGPGCNGLLCWKTGRPQGQTVKQRACLHPRRTDRHLCFGRHGTSKAIHRIRR